MADMWSIGGKELTSRLMIGSAGYPTLQSLLNSIEKSKAEVVTVSLRRARLDDKDNSHFLKSIEQTGAHILPNTSGCFSLNDIITISEMARELFETNWVKLEAIGDDFTLMPDPILLIDAAKELIKRGFIVFPYTSPDIVVCQHLADSGCDILMPLAAPIGTGQGPVYKENLLQIRDRFPRHQLIIDAGLGKPSHAAEVMEMGYDGILLNTAIAKATIPEDMAYAFATAIEAGRMGYQAGLIAQSSHAIASSPLIDQPFWHREQS